MAYSRERTLRLRICMRSATESSESSQRPLLQPPDQRTQNSFGWRRPRLEAIEWYQVARLIFDGGLIYFGRRRHQSGGPCNRSPARIIGGLAGTPYKGPATAVFRPQLGCSVQRGCGRLHAMGQGLPPAVPPQFPLGSQEFQRLDLP
jgi:hypothetical protein